MANTVPVFLRYDRRMLEVQLPEHNLAGILEGKFPEPGLTEEEQLLEVARSIAEPIGGKTLPQIIAEKSAAKAKAAEELTVVIMCSDMTRPSPSYKILPPLVEELGRCGIQDENVTIMFGLGSHRNQTPDEMKALIGEEMFCRFKCVDSTPGEFVNIGTTSRGTPLFVNKIAMDADIHIGTGNVDYHWFAGYSAGSKAFFPGACHMDSVRPNHKMAVLPECQSGALNTNPLRMDIDEAGSMIGIDFIVNVIINDLNQHIIRSFAGDYMLAHRAACKYVDEIYGYPIEEKADVVIASSGGFPKDINIDQMQKALENAFRGVKKGGTLLITAACHEGYGKQLIKDAFNRISHPSELLQPNLLDPAEGIGAKEGGYAKVSANCRVIMVTELPDEEVRNMFWEPCRPEDIQKVIDEITKDAKRVFAMPLACSVMPIEK